MINYKDIEMPPITPEENRMVRAFIATNHEDGKCSIYSDDGELQCGNIARHGRQLDFMREPISDLIANVYATRVKESIEEMRRGSKEVVL